MGVYVHNKIDACIYFHLCYSISSPADGDQRTRPKVARSARKNCCTPPTLSNARPVCHRIIRSVCDTYTMCKSVCGGVVTNENQHHARY